MKKNYVLVSVFTLIHQIIYSQKINISKIKSSTQFDNIYSQLLFTDSNKVSSFLIEIKKEVKAHKHLEHAEHVYILEGRGEMKLGADSFKIKKGDLIFIPANTFHSVKTHSKKSLKVISIQAPYFDGKDRILLSN